MNIQTEDTRSPAIACTDKSKVSVLGRLQSRNKRCKLHRCR